MSASFIVTGVKEVDRALAELPAKLQKTAVRKAGRTSAKIVQAAAKNNLRDVNDEGHLEKSVKVKAGKRSRTVWSILIQAGAVFDGSENAPWYAGFIELGTEPRFTKSGASRGAITPRKYLRPGLYDNEDNIRKVFIKELKAQLRSMRPAK